MRIRHLVVSLLALVAILLVAPVSRAAECPAGFFSIDGNEPCTPCAPGTFSASLGSLACTPCLPGTSQPSAGSSACVDCAPGTYSSSLAALACTECDAGFHQPSTGQLACLPCAPGSYAADTGSASCTTCDPGGYSFAAAVTCTPCEAGRYQPSAGSAACIACAAGTYQPATGSVECVDCAAGTFTPDTGSAACATCTSCPAGQFETALCTATGDAACDLCDASCATCSGPGASACLSCASGNPPEAGVCLPGCTAAPADGCRLPAVAGKAVLTVKDNAVDGRDLLSWRWLKGSATTIADFGDPVNGDGYFLCVYDGAARVSSMSLPAGGLCAGKPCWAAKKTGFGYRDKELTPDGALVATLKAGTEGKAMIVVTGKGVPLETPDPSIFTGPIRVQLQRADGGICFEAEYGAPFKKNKSGTFMDVAD